MPRRGVVQGPPVFTPTPRRDKTSVCGCTVGSSAFKTHRRPKKHSSSEVPRSGHSCYRILIFDRDGKLWHDEARRGHGHGPHEVSRRRARSSAGRVRGRREVDVVVA